MNEKEVLCLEELQQHAKQTYSEELSAVMLAKDFCQHSSISIDTLSLLDSNLTFAHLLFGCPRKALKLLDQAFLKAAYIICQNKSIKTNIINKVNIHVRLMAIPNLPEIYRTNLPNCSDVGKFICISGTVIRGTMPKVLEFRKLWKCKKCKFNFTIDAEVEKGYIFEKPFVCPNPEWCNGKNFALLSTEVDPEYCKDYREVKIQQQFNTLTVGSVPKSMWVILEDDLVETCQPGNDIDVSGVLIQRWKPLSKGGFIEIDLVMFAHNVEVKNKMKPGILPESLVMKFGKFWTENQKDPLKGRDLILSSICPQVFGLYVVKLAVALILAGGVEKNDGNSRIRGDSHLLLVGDPGTGKSQFLKFASKVCMRAVLTSGIGTTNAGLTASAIKEGGKWQLEAGALVLADGGVCCIDEFSCIKEHDKTCIHEAMEQQTISVAKAGLVCSLSSKCSILAATNPKGKYDENLTLSENIALASPLLSRFDIILVLLDTCDENWDNLVSSYIMGECKLSIRVCKESAWSLEKVKSYFNLIRNINPKMNASCDRVLQAYYKRQRSLEERNCARTTPRLLQSLLRLAEGHARLMFRSEVLVIDAIIAIVLMESSMSGSAILDELTTLHTSFSKDPAVDYSEKAKIVLKHLNLEELLEDSEDYRFSYQDLGVKSLLSEVSELCDTTDNSYSGVSFGFKGNSAIDDHSKTSTDLTDCSKSTSIVPGDDVTYYLKKLLPIDDCIYSEKIPIDTTMENLCPISLNKKKEQGFVNDPKKSPLLEKQKRNSLLEKQNVTPRFNKVGNLNEISTLSDLINTFCDEQLQSQDKTLAFPKSKIGNKRKTEDYTEEVDPEFGLVNQNSHSSTVSTEIDFKIPSLGSSHSLSSLHQAKKVCVEKPSELKSFKRFTFQTTSGKNSVLAVNGKNIHLNQEHLTNELSNVGEVRPNLNGNVNSKTAENIKVGANSKSNLLSQSSTKNVEVCKSGPSDVTHKSSAKKIRKKCPGNVGASNDVTNKRDDRTEPNKFVEAFKKFAFKSRSSKKDNETLQPKASDNISHASQSVSDTSKISSQSIKNIMTTQSSQSVFKRIFPGFVGKIDEEDLDDLLFKI